MASHFSLSRVLPLMPMKASQLLSVTAILAGVVVVAVAAIVYFGFFFLMPAYTRETSDKTTMTKLYFIAMAIATLATLYYWWVFDGGADGTMLVKLIVTVIAAGHFLIFGIKPWLKPEQSKPVPERVTG